MCMLGGMCVCERCGLFWNEISLTARIAKLFSFLYYLHVNAICCWRPSGVVNGHRRPSTLDVVTVSSGARLCGWLAWDGFQTLSVLMMLSAEQQKGRPSSWRGLPLRRGNSSWMVRVWEWMQVCAASWNRGSTWWWQMGFAGVTYVSLINDGA